jgi:hypothetical protein
MDSKYVSGTPEIARFDFTRVNNAGVDKTQKRIEMAAEYLWSVGYGNHGTDESPILFSSLTKRQKLDLVSDHLERVIRDAASSFKSNQAQDAARTQAQTDFDTND